MQAFLEGFFAIYKYYIFFYIKSYFGDRGVCRLYNFVKKDISI